MHRMRNRWDTIGLLDKPVVPRSRLNSGHQVDRLWVAGVAVENVRHGGVFPVHADGVIQRPNDNGVTVWNDDGLGQVDIHVLERGLEVVTRNRLAPVWSQGTWLSAASRLSEPERGVLVRCRKVVWVNLLGAIWRGGRLTGVRPDGTTIEVVATLTGCGDIASEPVVAGALVGGDDHIVTLTRNVSER